MNGFSEEQVTEALTTIIATLVDKYADPKPDICKVISDCQPPNKAIAALFNEKYDYHTQCLRSLINYLRYTTGDHLEKLGFIKPVQFRRDV